MDANHISDDDIEEYLMGRIWGQPRLQLEEHLLACDECALRAAYAEMSIAEIKTILSHVNDYGMKN